MKSEIKCNLMTEHSNKITPTTPIQYLKGVGPHLSQILQRKSIYTAWDLLFYLPIKYVDRRKLFSIRDLPMEKKQTLLAEVQKYTVRPMKNRRKILEIVVSDRTGVAKMTFFQFNDGYLRKKFPEGSRVLFFGDVRSYSGFKTMSHPEMEIWEEVGEDADGIDQALKIYPFYSLTEGLYQKTIRGIIHKNLDDMVAMIEEDPRSVRESGQVQISLAEAFRHVHEPPVDSNLDELNEQRTAFHQRIIYDEFFYLQLGLVSKRYRQATRKTFVINNDAALFAKGVSNLPYELTQDQRTVLDDIREDLSSSKPMNRMVQGDVGSGKTVVAFLSSLMAIQSGFQVALMAPTEILAEQHFKNLFPFEEKLGIRVEILTGATSEKNRNRILYDLEQGVVNLLIGTHALLTADVNFHNLGYVVIDEQHRFGVKQRALLKNKTRHRDGDVSPHLLVMTATPIPRSLSMCVYGDVDLSVIRMMPKGRKPIVTKIYREKQRHKLYEFVHSEIAKGRQAYFVYPLVEESEKLDLKNATLMHQNLSLEFSKFKVGLIHGKMKSQEKDAAMEAFKKNEIQVLVSTTVIEVGVDVPNATVMVIEHAERFGLSQLHQLRGRVGRGSESSYCFLVAGYAQSQESQFRLKVMEDTTDGFVIAEEDLKLRGPGEFLGTRQSGMPDFRLAQIVRDGHLLSAAKKRAEEILAEDTLLDKPDNERLKRIMLGRWGQRLDLSLV